MENDIEKTRLLEKLAAFHRELKEVHDLDPESRAALAQIAADIEGLVEQSRGEPAVSDPERHSFLSEQVEKFETNHPVATRFLAQLTDVLGSIGI